MQNNKLFTRTTWVCLTIGVTISIGFLVNPVVNAEGLNLSTVTSRSGIDADATRILQSMSAYMAQTKAFSVNADIDLEVVTRDAEKLQISSFATIELQRPDKFYMRRRGLVADAEFFFDGKALTLHGTRMNVYAQIPVNGKIDDGIRAYEWETGLPAPGADLLFADPYAVLSEGVRSSTYLGTTYIDGIECHHLAFREDEVDWQIWIQVGDRPLPMKYVITSKWRTGAPEYSLRLRNWNTNPQISASRFTFSAPARARRLDALPTSELDELTTTEEAQP